MLRSSRLSDGDMVIDDCHNYHVLLKLLVIIAKPLYSPSIPEGKNKYCADISNNLDDTLPTGV